MLGAIAGDVIGSVYEARPIKSTDFPLFQPRCRFTDDTVLTVATADVILRGLDYAGAYRAYFRRYPHAGYGGMFLQWGLSDDLGAYHSFGNGSAMRVSPVGWAFSDLGDVLAEAKRSAAVTHDHPEGIKGAQAVAAAVYLARSGRSKQDIREFTEETFGYDLETPLDEIRPHYRFDVTCQGSVPQAFRAFLESTDFEDAVRLAISLGGDSDTLACMTGSIAEAFYGGVPGPIGQEVFRILEPHLAGVVRAFAERFALSLPPSA